MAHLRWFGLRLLRAVAVLLATTFLVSLLIHLVPGDPGRTLLGLQASPATVHRLDHALGVDRPVFAQYLIFLGHVLNGSFGESISFQQSVGSLIAERLPVTLWLIVFSAILVVLIATPLALLAASAPGQLRDHLVRAINVLALGMPVAVLGILFVQYAAVDAGTFPPGGFGHGVAGHIRALFLPSLILAISLVPLVVRSLRAAMLKVLQSEHVVVARAKGISEAQLRRRHILRNALPAAVVVLGINLAYLVGGTLIVERVFSLPGLGSLLLDGISGRDFAVIQGVTLTFAVLVTIIGLLSDVAQAALDPRVGLA